MIIKHKPISKYLIYLGSSAVLLAVCWLFFVKQYAKDLGGQLEEVTQQINQEQDSIHMFRAELSYLKSPNRMKNLAEKYLKLEAIKPSQMIADFVGTTTKNTNSLAMRTVKSGKNSAVNSNIRLAGWRYKKGPANKYIIETSAR